MKRWIAKISYRTDSGINIETHEFEELDELHNIVELGPHWDTIVGIAVNIQRHSDSDMLTVEKAFAL